MTKAPRAGHRSPLFGRGLAWRIALVGIASALVAVGIATLGIWAFRAELAHIVMVAMDQGQSTSSAYAMFDDSVRDLLFFAIGVAIVASIAINKTSNAVTSPQRAREIHSYARFLSTC